VCQCPCRSAARRANLIKARLEALDAVLDGADLHEVVLISAHALAQVAPDCCAEHMGKFETARLLRLRECAALRNDDHAAASVH
jgi:hypothetical protein